MDKLKTILREYLNKGSEKIDVTMVLALIDQIKKDTKEQLLLHNVSQQRELLLAYNEEINQCMVDSQDILEESDVDEFLANNCG
jgi:hypothetical protein